MGHTVIVGAGPIGLYTAIKLKQLGVNVTVIDPRAGDGYTRPGGLDMRVFDQLERYIGQPIDCSSSRHIKDVERSLYKIAVSLGINIQQQSFNTLVDHGVAVTDKQSTTVIPCDLVIDCTGSKRAVIHDVNKRHEKPPFPIETIGDNPLKNHFIAYISMTPEDVELLYNPLPIHSDPLQHTLALESLRAKFGWPEFSEPGFNYQPLAKNKVCLYFETPPGLEKSQQEAWLTALLQLKTGNKDIHFSQTSKPSLEKKPKPKFTPFTLNPHRTTTVAYKGHDNLPMTLPLGDAQIDADYRLGLGIITGTARVNAWLHSITINHGEITDINLGQYEAEIKPQLLSYEQEIAVSLRDRATQLHNDLKIAEQKYRKALQLSTHTDEQLLIEKSLAEILHRRAMYSYRKGVDGYQHTLDEHQNISIDKYGNVQNVLLLARSEKALVKALKYLTELKSNDRNLVCDTLLNMAEKYAALGRRLFALHRLQESEVYFKKALALDTKYFPDLTIENTIKNYSNLVILANKKNGFDEAISWADQALSLLASSTIVEKEKFAYKLIFNKTFAVLTKALNQLDKGAINEQAAALLCKDSSMMIAVLRDKQLASTIELATLTDKLNLLEDRISQRRVQPRS